jgi:hypothetical protein
VVGRLASVYRKAMKPHLICVASKNRCLPGLLLGLLLFTACVTPPEGEESSNELYRDAFVPGQSGDWLLEEDELGNTAIVNEQLVVTVKSQNTMQFATLESLQFSDFVLEVDARQSSGNPDSSYGVLFRMQDNSQFYRFEITSDGHFMLERHNADGSWTRLVPEWAASAAINQGLNVVNRLKIIASGSQISVYANDVLLQQVADSTYGSGTIAVDAGSFGDTNLQVAFDNLVVYGQETAQQSEDGS